MRITFERPLHINLGDSFAAGLGSEATPTRDGNEIDMDVYRNSSGLAFRSTRSGAALLARQRGYELRDVSYSGADVEQLMFTGTRGEPPQISRVTEDADLVTLIVGANDTGFLNLVHEIRSGEVTPESRTARIIAGLTNALQGRIELVLREVTRRAPNAEVRVAGYPYLYPRPGQPSGPLGSFLSEGEKALMQRLQDRVNDAIRGAVELGGSRVRYVDPNAPGSPFITVDEDGPRELTSRSPRRWVNGEADIGTRAFLVHPSARGNEYYAQLYAESLVR